MPDDKEAARQALSRGVMGRAHRQGRASEGQHRDSARGRVVPTATPMTSTRRARDDVRSGRNGRRAAPHCAVTPSPSEPREEKEGTGQTFCWRRRKTRCHPGTKAYLARSSSSFPRQ